MMAHPFMPMTNEILEKLTRAAKDSISTIQSPELPAVFASKKLKSGLDLNSPRSESNQSDLRTDNRY